MTCLSHFKTIKPVLHFVCCYTKPQLSVSVVTSIVTKNYVKEECCSSTPGQSVPAAVPTDSAHQSRQFCWVAMTSASIALECTKFHSPVFLRFVTDMLLCHYVCNISNNRTLKMLPLTMFSSTNVLGSAASSTGAHSVNSVQVHLRAAALLKSQCPDATVDISNDLIFHIFFQKGYLHYKADVLQVQSLASESY